MTEQDVTKILLIIANEYEDFLPEDDERMKLKQNTWYESLKNFDKELVNKKTIELLHSHTYGTPKLPHLMSLLKPEAKEQNLGQEYADRFVKLLGRYGTHEMGTYIKSEFGEVGYQVYLNNKESARLLLESDVLTFKAQIRNVFNSVLERRQLGISVNDLLENKSSKMNDLINSGANKMAIEV